MSSVSAIQPAGTYAPPVSAGGAVRADAKSAGCSSCGSSECAGCGDKKVGGVGELAAGGQTTQTSSSVADQFQLSDAEQKQVNELKARDREVRAHEQAHKAVGGQYAGAISYDYQQGPDGKRYAVGGEVPIDASEIPGDPEATIEKMRVVKAAALAPAEPSGQDRKVAAMADAAMMKAQAELNAQKAEEQNPDAPEATLDGDLNQQLAELRERDDAAVSREPFGSDASTPFSAAPSDLTAYAANAYAQQAA